jgi:hypothetical protein
MTTENKAGKPGSTIRKGYTPRQGAPSPKHSQDGHTPKDFYGGHTPKTAPTTAPASAPYKSPVPSKPANKE